MSNLPESAVWTPTVDQIETDDAVLGGPDGVINVQAKQLADRTAFLKAATEAAAGVALGADGKADQALGQIAVAEAAAGSSSVNAAAALAHKNAALAAQALAEQARTGADAAQLQASNAATYAYQAQTTTQQKASDATTAATTAVNAASAAVVARDSFVATSSTAAAAISSLAATKVAEIEDAGATSLAPVQEALDATLSAAAQASAQAVTAVEAAGTSTAERAAAVVARTAAETASAVAQAARDAATVNALVYTTTAAGLAVTADGQQFQVVGANEIIRYARTNSTTATELARYPASAPVQEAIEFGTRRQRYLDRLRTAGSTRPKAAVVVLLGQSLNAPRNAIVATRGAPVAKMPFGGASITNWQFFAANATHVGHWSELASVVDFEERTAQTPMVGVVNTIIGGKFASVYIGSVAIGARSLQVLMTGGPATNLWAILQRLCALALADGFDPEVMFYTAHGEANASEGTTEQDYYDLGVEYYGRAQLYAAQAMRKPGYVAPIVFTSPAPGTIAGLTYAEIREAIRRLARDLPGGIDFGGIYQWPTGSDRVHPTQEGYIQRGEAVGRALRSYAEDGKRWGALHITDVTLSGTQFVATFSGPVERDTTLNVGQNLNTALAEDGFEWFDNGAQIGITAVVYEGWKVRGTLASAPVGLISQQVLRIASQTTDGSLKVGPENLPGSLVRAQGEGWPSILTHTYVNRVWAAPQVFDEVRAV
jgi:hypothetical protein